jgi:predicted transcriptional regulator
MAEQQAERTPFYFDPSATGLAVFLGPTESEVMEILWARGPLTAKRVQLFLEGKSPRAYTTIVTILGNLVTKGLLTKKREDRQFSFTPTGTEDAFVSERIKVVTSCLQRNFQAKKK